MIKFFRRIRYKLMEQNKTGRYLKYAIGEIALVMIGILLALQVNNWNENRKLQAQELNLAKQLLEDTKADSVFFQSRITHQQKRDTLFTNLINFSNNIKVDSLAKIDVNDDPFFFRLAYQSNLINNNPEAYDLISNNAIKTILRDYKTKYDYVVHSIELNNRICEEYGLPLQIKYYSQLQQLPELPVISNLGFALNDNETIAKFELFRNYGVNYYIQVRNFLDVNRELMKLLENYISNNE